MATFADSRGIEFTAEPICYELTNALSTHYEETSHGLLNFN